MPKQTDEAASKLPAWEREKLVRHESKLRREKLTPPSHQPQGNRLDQRTESTRRQAPERVTNTFDKKSSIVGQHHSVTCDNEPESAAIWVAKKPTATLFDNGTNNQTFHASVPAATVPTKAPKVHTLAPTLVIRKPFDQQKQDCDALSIASSDTNSDGEDDKLMDSLEFSIAVSPKPKPCKVTLQPTPSTIQPGLSSTPHGHNGPAPAQPKAPTRPPEDHTQAKKALSVPVITPKNGHQVDQNNGTMSKPLSRPPPPQDKPPKSTKPTEGEAKLLAASKPNALTPRRDVPVDKSPPPRPPPIVASESKPKAAIAAQQPSKAAAKTVRDAKWDVFAPPKPKLVEFVPQPTSEPKPKSDTVRGARAELSLSMEEEQLRREISSLDSKLEKVRLVESDDDEEDVTKDSSDSADVALAYGGGTHHKVGTRTAPVDRCSLEKRKQMSGVHQTRVRKGVQVHVHDETKADVKKTDKVVVKKDLAVKMLLS